MKNAPKLFSGEKWLVLTGLLGLVLGGFCAILIVVKGVAIPPEGNLYRAVSFDVALGIFLLTTAAIVPLAGFRPRMRAIFRLSYIVLALYSYGTETIQHIRGINPRFPEHGTSLDSLFAMIFGFVALLLIIFYVILALRFFSKGSLSRRPLLIMAIRYAMIIVMISFAAGIWISVIQSRYTGLEGNIIWFHGFGFHALQAVPFIAWLLERSRLLERGKRMRVHLGGWAWIVGILCIGVQTFMGRSIFEWSPFMVICLICLITWIGITVQSIVQVFRDKENLTVTQ